jgi:hypothetical protein
MDLWMRADRAVQWMVAILSLCVLTACSDKPSPPGPVRPEVKRQFTLAAAGLAEKGKWKGTPVLADVNADGFLDLVATARLGDGVHVWLGNGQGSWRDSSDGLAQSSSCGGGIAVVDVNGDGHMDLAVADHCEGVSVYLGDGQGHWVRSAKDLNPAIAYQGTGAKQEGGNEEETQGVFLGAEDLAVGDINEDGHPDIVAAASDRGGFTVYLGDGTGANWREDAEADGLPSVQDPEFGDEQQAGWANQVLLLDLNQDGHLDVIASYYAGPRVWLGDGKGRFRFFSQGLPTPSAGGLFRGVDVGDINGDGRLDLVMANDVNGPEVFLQQADGTWMSTPDLFPAMNGGAVAVALADINRDGHPDVIVGGRKGKDLGSIYGVFVLLGNGKGAWTELLDCGLPAEGLSVTWGVAVGDVNGDGFPDFALSTGGSVPGGMQGPSKGPNPPKKDSAEGQRAAAARSKSERRYVEELPLPRMQVWLNGFGG